MRKNRKYKIYKRRIFSLSRYPTKILTFKKSKWFDIKERILNSKKTLEEDENIDLYFDIEKLVASFDWEDIKDSYKKELESKRLFGDEFRQSYTINNVKKSVKKEKQYKKLIYDYLIKPEFRIDILLYNIGFFTSPYFARHEINNGTVLVNSKPIMSNYYVKRGDIISINYYPLLNSEFLSNYYSKFPDNNRIYSFVEIDYYSGKIVVLKDYKLLSAEDIYLISLDYINIRNLTQS